MYSAFFCSYISSSSLFSLRFPEIVSDQMEVVLFAKSPETKLFGLSKGFDMESILASTVEEE